MEWSRLSSNLALLLIWIVTTLLYRDARAVSFGGGQKLSAVGPLERPLTLRDLHTPNYSHQVHHKNLHDDIDINHENSQLVKKSNSNHGLRNHFQSSLNTSHSIYKTNYLIPFTKRHYSSQPIQKSHIHHHHVSTSPFQYPESLPTPAEFQSRTTVFSNTLAGPGLAAMFTPPPSFQNNNIKPSFGGKTPTNVTVIRGRMAELKCAVENLGTKSVSWVRHNDIHVLTVGRITFTNDARFVAHNKPGSNVWSLRIKFPQPRDSGLYECQVSIRPPLARVVQLNVVEPQAIIPPGRELFVDGGSPLNITCIIPDSPEPPRNVFWYHQSKMVTFDGSRQGVSVTTEKGDVTTSILRIAVVKVQDSGVYICSPEGMKEATVTVSVLHGELPQAMQTGSTCRACFGSNILLMLILFYHSVVPYIVSPLVSSIKR